MKLRGAKRANTVLSYKSKYAPQISTNCGTSKDPLARIDIYKEYKSEKVIYASAHVYAVNTYPSESVQCTFTASISSGHNKATLSVDIEISADGIGR